MSTFIKAGFWEKLCKPCKGYKGWLNLDEFVQSFIPKPTYKVFTALLTQYGESNNILQNTGAVTIGVTYKLSGVSNVSDFSNVGGPAAGFAIDDTYFIATDSLVPTNYGGGNLIYDSGAPIVRVLENTLGNLWFTYNGQGLYLINSNSLFSSKKTFFTITNTSNFMDVGNVVDYMYINSIDNINMGSVIFPSGDGIDSTMVNTPIEIRVYN